MGRSYVKFSKNKGMEHESIGAPRAESDYSADSRELDRHFDAFVTELKGEVMREENSVGMVALSESLKVRVITKSRAIRSFLLMPMQKFLWSTVKSNPAFALIGQPVDKWQVQSRLGSKLGETEGYLSGDYSAATDNLAPWVSECIANEICDLCEVDDETRVLMLEALTRHVIQNPDDEKMKLKQTWGQLMGSVISFPILCIANAALCRWSLELAYLKKMSLKQTTIMVNGDDCVFRTTLEGLRLWEKITTFAGLTPSVGKFFYTREFAQINSANFYRLDIVDRARDPVSGIWRDVVFRETSYVNLGLLLGLSRSGEQVEVDTGDKPTGVGLAERCTDLLVCCPEDLRMTVMQQFLDLHRTVLSEAFRGVPYFVPKAYGGIGLPCFYPFVPKPPTWEVEDEEGWKEYHKTISKYPATFYMLPEGVVRQWMPTKLDLQIAHRLLTESEKYRIGVIPAEGTWDIRKLSKQRIPFAAVEHSDQQAQDESATETLFGLLAVDTLFTVQRVGMEVKEDNARKRVANRNAKSWTEALRQGTLPPPLSMSTLFASVPDKPTFACRLTVGHTPETMFERERRKEREFVQKWEEDLWK